MTTVAYATPEKGIIEYSDDILRSFTSPTLLRTPLVAKKGVLGSAARIRTPSRSRTTTPSRLRDSTTGSLGSNATELTSTRSLSAGRPSIVSLPINLQNNVVAASSSNQAVNGTTGVVLGGNWSLEGFTMSKPLGKGKFGNVYHAKQKGSNVPVALKVLFKAQIQCELAQKMLKREVEIQYRLQHENILKLYGYFQDAKNVYLMLEYAEGGEYTKFLAQNGHNMHENVCRQHMSQITAGLAYMHTRSVMHRDIKPENILIDNKGQLKIADLGSSVHMLKQATQTSKTDSGKRYTMCGTPEYLAPEMIRCAGHDHSIDIWALGILMYEIMFKRTPFTDNPSLMDNNVQNRKRGRDSFEDVPADSSLIDDEEKENIQRRQLYHRILSFVDGRLSFEFSHVWLFKQQQFLSSANNAATTTTAVEVSVPAVSPQYQQHILQLLRSEMSQRPSATEVLQMFSQDQ